MYSVRDSDFNGCLVIVVIVLLLAAVGAWKAIEWVWPVLKAAIAAGWAAA